MQEEKQTAPLITVIMPSYNAGKYIRQAVKSVLHQQGDFGIELLILDDASTDDTAGIAGELIEKQKAAKAGRCSCQLTYLRNEKNLGVAETRNIGIRMAKGKYLAFLDADDWWRKDKLRRQAGFLKKYDAVLCATGRELMNADGSSMGRYIGVPQEITYPMLLCTNSIACSSVLMRTEVAREFYMSHDELHEDYILWLRVLKKYKKAYGINEPMLKSRMSEGGKSRNKLKSAGMQFGVYRYMGYGVLRSTFYFVQYALHGVLKYHGRAGCMKEEKPEG